MHCRVTNTNSTKIQTFINRCLQRILRLRWFDRVPNIDVWMKANQAYGCPSQTAKMVMGWPYPAEGDSNITRQALEWNPQGKRKRERPKQTWRRSLRSELKNSGLTWEETRTNAGDRTWWRGAVETPCSSRSEEDKVMSSQIFHHSTKCVSIVK